MGAIIRGKEILVMNGDLEIVVAGSSGTVTPGELAALVNNNAVYFTHEGNKFRLSSVSESSNTYLCIDANLNRKVIKLDKVTGDWTYHMLSAGMILLTAPTEDAPADNLIRQVLLPLSEKGTEYLGYTYMYYKD